MVMGKRWWWGNRFQCAHLFASRSFALKRLPPRTTPRQVSARGGHQAVVDLLLDLCPGKGCPLGACLVQAASRGHADLVRDVVQRGRRGQLDGVAVQSQGGLQMVAFTECSRKSGLWVIVGMQTFVCAKLGII